MTTSNTDGPWQAVAVSVIGAAHVLAGMPCQDASLCFASDDVLVACVADGAGSARYSDEGSRIAVDEFVSVSRYLLMSGDGLDPPKIVSRAFEAACTAVRETAGCDLSEFATTLLGLVVVEDSLAAIQVGDGAVIVEGAGGDRLPRSGIHQRDQVYYQSPCRPSLFSACGDIRRIAISSRTVWRTWYCRTTAMKRLLTGRSSSRCTTGSSVMRSPKGPLT